MSDLRAALKEKTRDIHMRVEGLPFFQALDAGELSKSSLLSYFRCLAILHHVLDRTVQRSEERVVTRLGQGVARRAPLLTADLQKFDSLSVPSVTPAIHAAIALGSEILRSSDDPLALGGFLYVIEGSQLGGAVLKTRLARALGTPAESLTHLSDSNSESAADWRGFIAVLNGLTSTPELSERVIHASVDAFVGIEKIISALHPIEERDLRHHVAVLNPEAGDHAMPQDPAEITLALEAGARAWKKFPYLEARYGDRGRRFTSSDSCWLVQLSHHPSESVTRSLRWLSSVLASRGLPTLILEEHLREIARDLGGETSSYDPFLLEQASRRESAIREKRLSELASRYSAAFDACSGFRVPAAAELILAAWVDERSGISGAFVEVAGWFSGTERFSPEWIRVVRELCDELGAPC